MKIQMTSDGHAMLDKFPDLKARLPIMEGGITLITMAFAKSLKDAEFVCFVGLPCDFRVDNKTLDYIQNRMIDLGIAHMKDTKERAISTKQQILRTKN